MKKLLVSFLIVVMSSLLVACGSSNSELTSDKKAEYESQSDYVLGFVDTGLDQDTKDEYLSMKDEKLDFLLTYTDLQGSQLKCNAEDFKKIIESWNDAENDFGQFVSKDEYSVEETNQGIEVSCECNFENRSATMTFIYDEDGYVTTLNVNGHYTGGEIAKKAGLNTLLGMGTVFIMLIFISFVISLFNYLPGGTKSFKKKAKVTEEPKVETVKVEKSASAPAVSNDGEIVAAITAAISAYTGKSGDSFIVRSIKRKGSR